jgi:ribosomal protein S27E
MRQSMNRPDGRTIGRTKSTSHDAILSWKCHHAWHRADQRRTSRALAMNSSDQGHENRPENGADSVMDVECPFCGYADAVDVVAEAEFQCDHCGTVSPVPKSQKQLLKKRHDQFQRDKERKQRAGVLAESQKRELQLRYPNLSAYLTFLQFILRLFTGIASVCVFLWAANVIWLDIQIAGNGMAAGLHFLYGLGAELAVVLEYVAGMAGIEFVKVICSIEQETVLTREELQKLTRQQSQLD